MSHAAIDIRPSNPDPLSRALADARALAPSVDRMIALLRAADELNARAAEMLASLSRTGEVERATGLPTEMAVRLEGRKMLWDARELARVADGLRSMPRTAEALRNGTVSWSQARAIVRAADVLNTAGRAAVDELIARRATWMADAEPEALLDLVEDQVARRRQDLLLRREDRAIETSFLAVQARLGGGGTLYGEADTLSFATIVDALDAAAALPVNADEHPGSRARQRMDALVSICEASVGGGTHHTRPRPRLIATVELRDLMEMGASEGARVLWGLAGRPPRLTRIAAETLACDADVVPVVFDGTRPVAVGDSRATVPGKARVAVIARDGGCRFPGCRAPVAWCDVHHLVPGDRSVHRLILLCRRCHRRVHRHRWRITPQPDGTIRFRHRGRTCSSAPRARAPARE